MSVTFKNLLITNFLGKTLGLAVLLLGFLFLSYLNASKIQRQIKTFKNKEKDKLHSNLRSLLGNGLCIVKPLLYLPRFIPPFKGLDAEILIIAQSLQKQTFSCIGRDIHERELCNAS